MFIQPMLFGDFFKDVIFVDAVKHPAMAKLAEIFHGPVAMALHGLQTAPFWLALAGWRCRTTCTWSIPHCPRHQGARAALYRCWKTSTTWTGSTRTSWQSGARALGTGPLEGGDQAIIDGAMVNGSWKLVRLGFRSWCAGCRRVYLPLRLGDDSGCVRADDLVCLARLSSCSSSNKENNKMGLLSLAIWTPIVFGACLLALGRDEHSRAVRWIALIGAVAGCW
jgi:hypothetical protein